MDKDCYNVYFLDDQMETVHVVKNFVKQFPFLKEVSSASDIYRAKEYLDHYPVDILFLDIEMPNLNGFDFLDLFENPPVVILCTAHPQYGYESSKYNVAGYIPKLPGYHHLKEVVHRAVDMVDRKSKQIKKQCESIAVKAYPGKKLVNVPLNAIKYAEIQDKQLFIYLESVVIETIMTMEHFKNLLPDDQFAQVSRSYLISKRYIDNLTDKCVYMQGEVQIPISSHYLPNLHRILR